MVHRPRWSGPILDRRAFLAAAAVPSLTVLPGCSALSGAAGRLHEYDIVARPAPAALQLPDRAPVSAWTYGGTVPGPEIRVPQGSRLRVNLLNQLPVATTMHWHGIRVPNAMDGVPHLTQAPVPPGGRFSYEFPVLDAGTFWYHSHQQSAEQIERGLHGALIVEERQPLTVDRELTWVLDDWRLTREGQLSGNFLAMHDVTHAGRIGNVVTVNGTVPGAVPVQRGERLRLRLVNAANARLFGLVFDGHLPLVIAIDGQPVRPHAPAEGRVVLAPGMRVDLVLDAIGEPGKRYAVGDVLYPRAAYDLLQLAYGATPLRESSLPAPGALTANPLAEPDLQNASVHDIRFEGGMMGNLHTATLDGRPMKMAELMRSGKAWAVNGVVAAGHEQPHRTSNEHARVHGEAPALNLRLGSSYLLRLQNDTRWHHPIHLHGHSFRVLSRNGRATTHREWQDTVLMAPEERVEIALVADNPGLWMLHCHVLEHQHGGMMATVRVA